MKSLEFVVLGYSQKYMKPKERLLEVISNYSDFRENETMIKPNKNSKN